MMFSSSDSINLAHLMFIFQSFSIFGFGVSQMFHLNISYKRHLISFIMTLILITISLLIMVPEELRIPILK